MQPAGIKLGQSFRSGCIVLWLFVIASIAASSNLVLLSDPAPPGAKLRWKIADVGHFASEFSGDGLSLFTFAKEDRDVYLNVWDLRAGKRLRRHKLPLETIDDSDFRDLAGGRYFACRNKEKVLCIDLHTGVEHAHDMSSVDIPGFDDVRGLCMSPKGDWFSQYDGYYRLHFIDTKTGKIFHTVGRLDAEQASGTPSEPRFTVDGKHFYYSIGGETSAQVDVFDTETRKVIITIPNLLGYPIVSSNGTLLVVPTGDVGKRDSRSKRVPGQLAIWSLRERREKFRIPRKDLEFRANHYHVEFTRDAQRFAVWKSEVRLDKIVEIWDADSGKRTMSVEVDGFPFQCKFAPNGKTLAIRELDKLAVLLVDVARQRTIWTSDPMPLLSEFYFTPDSKSVVLACHDGLRYFDTSTGAATKKVSPISGGEFVLIGHGNYLAFREHRRRDGKPIKVDEPGVADLDDYVQQFRVVHLNSGREVFRIDEPEYCKFHFPGDHRTLIQVVSRGESSDVHCWDLAEK